MKKLYKTFVVYKDRLFSPFQNYEYGKMNDILGKKFCCEDFDESDEECSRGFYATDIDGLVYHYINSAKEVVFEVEMSGKFKEFDQFKRRYEKMKIIRKIEKDMLQNIVKATSKTMDFNYYEAIFPINFKEQELAPFDSYIEKSLWEWDKLYKKMWPYIDGNAFKALSKKNKAYFDLTYQRIWSVIYERLLDKVGSSKIESLVNITYSYTASLFYSKEYKYKCIINLLNSGYLPIHNYKSWILYTGKEIIPTYKVEINEGNDNLFVKKLI